jgi:hypothetical protein
VTIRSRFDVSFRFPVGDPRVADLHSGLFAAERQVYDLSASLCELCCELYVDPELLLLLDVTGAHCVFAIETDSVLQELVGSAE